MNTKVFSSHSTSRRDQLNPSLRNGRNMTCVRLPRADHPHKLSARARRRRVREATKTAMTTLKELKALAAETGEILHQSKLYG